jgi:hypothetical protein
MEQEPSNQTDLITALEDEEGRASRIACCTDLAAAMTKFGQVLWTVGSIVGPDRISGRSPFRFGSDATVGLATVAQVGGQLLDGIKVLLPLDNRYAAMALVRQLVEVEYLAWAFAADQPQAASGLRSNREHRLKRPRTGHLSAVGRPGCSWPSCCRRDPGG